MKLLSEKLVKGSNLILNLSFPDYARHRLPKRTAMCPNCNALMVNYEKLTTSRKNKPLFGVCCLQGKTVLPQLNQIPDKIHELLILNTIESKDFRSSIRLYN